MTQQEVDSFDVVTMAFPTSYENAFLYIANPKNIPEWTVFFTQADETSAVLDTGEGPVDFGFKTQASFESGVIDWYMISEGGKRVDRSYSRLHRLPDGTCVYSFMFFLNPAVGEDPMAARVRQREQIIAELENLKAILTSG